MRVLLSAFALTALLLLAGAASVFAADGALVADAPATVEPVAPPPPSGTEAAAPAVDLVAETVDPIVDVAEPAVVPIVDVVDPVLEPVIDVVEPVVAPIVGVVDPVIDPVLDVVEPVVAPIVEIVDPVLDPTVDVIDPIVDVVEPIVDPIVDVIDPVTPPGLGRVDPFDADGATGPASPASEVVTWGAAASIAVASSILPAAWRPVSTDPAAPDSGAGGVGAETPSLGGVPYPRAPLLPLSDAAAAGSSLSLGAWIALLTAGLLAFVFHAFRRPWSSVPPLRGRSLLPALRPA